ncbi:FAD-dependent oxidoreductase [Vibrio sp. HN007]|uniref:FAD-dependent oxidoreductase n=1 Tax=Vibrio iocasae TaxID=3098914 RepID=UPI0035D45F16
MRSYDIAIIGAGPAGMQAAYVAASYGASVVVLHDKSSVGGQIYRNVSDSPLSDPNILGKDYVKGQALVERFQECSAEVLLDASVWHVGDNGEVLYSVDGQTHTLQAREVIIATGAMERPFPVKGWHLPGVMSAGSAQVMLKSDGLVKEDAVFAGSGPLLYVIVAQYLRLGVKVKAVVDTTPKQHFIRAGFKFFDALSKVDMAFKGIGLLDEIRRSKVPFYRYAEQLTVSGKEKVEGICFTQSGKKVEIQTKHVFLHQGVIPNLNLTRAIGLEHIWNEQQLCWHPQLDKWGNSSVENISVAGDSSAIVGADGAEYTGSNCALNVLYRLGKITKEVRDNQARENFSKLEKLNRFRKFIDTLYRPVEENRIPKYQNVIVCRCEERTVADLKQGFLSGAKEPNALKGLTRCGMGPCQGRQCGHTVSELLAAWRRKPVSEVGYYRLRSPMRLLTLEEFSHFNIKEPKSLPIAAMQHQSKEVSHEE